MAAERRLLITGLNGTLAPCIAAEATARGWQVLGWDRRRIPVHDLVAGAAWLDATRPDAIVHAATGDAAWAASLARWAAARDLPFVFTSTAMVFDAEPDGPHAPADLRTARDDYGRGKIACEDAVRLAHAGATVARLGWQIDPDRPGNNMLVQLDAWQQRDGRIAASRAWRPACSFMADTATALVDAIESPQAGTLHLDSNAEAGHRFDQIVTALRAQFDRRHWIVQVHEDYRHDQRLVGGPVALPPLTHRLPRLRGT